MSEPSFAVFGVVGPERVTLRASLSLRDVETRDVAEVRGVVLAGAPVTAALRPAVEFKGAMSDVVEVTATDIPAALRALAEVLNAGAPGAGVDLAADQRE